MSTKNLKLVDSRKFVLARKQMLSIRQSLYVRKTFFSGNFLDVIQLLQICYSRLDVKKAVWTSVNHPCFIWNGYVKRFGKANINWLAGKRNSVKMWMRNADFYFYFLLWLLFSSQCGPFVNSFLKPIFQWERTGKGAKRWLKLSVCCKLCLFAIYNWRKSGIRKDFINY